MSKKNRKLTPMTKELIIYLALFLIASPISKATLGMEHPLSFWTEIIGVVGLVVLAVRKIVQIIKGRGSKHAVQAGKRPVRSTEQYAEDLAREVSRSSLAITRNLRAQDKERAAQLSITMFALHLTYRTLKSKLGEQKALKITENVYNKAAGIMLENPPQEVRLKIYRHFLEFSIVHEEYPLTGKNDKPAGSLLWEYAKELHLELTDAEVKDIDAMQAIAEPLNELILELDPLSFTEGVEAIIKESRT